MEFTIKELMTKCQLEQKVAYALMTVLVGIGAAQEVGRRKEEGKKGPGEIVYRASQGDFETWVKSHPLPGV
jgi:hypothetical protein